MGLIKKIIRDKRYKVNQDIVSKMRELRKLGNSYQSIGDQFGVSACTALYWCDERQRNAQRIRTAKHKKTGEALKRSIQRDIRSRQERLESDPKSRLLHTINSMLTEKRTPRHSVYGMPKEQCIKLKETGVLRTPNSKIT